jgi:hypothetical protein
MGINCFVFLDSITNAQPSHICYKFCFIMLLRWFCSECLTDLHYKSNRMADKRRMQQRFWLLHHKDNKSPGVNHNFNCFLFKQLQLYLAQASVLVLETNTTHSMWCFLFSQQFNYFIAALMKAENNGCGLNGRPKNSG